MPDIRHFLSASEAARQLGISMKALRLYESRGLIRTIRTAAGWRTYAPEQMERATEIVTLRALGFSLATIAKLLDGDTQQYSQALAGQQSRLEGQVRQLNSTLSSLARLRARLDEGIGSRLPTKIRPDRQHPMPAINLPWPWGGERFFLPTLRRLNFIIGPLGSGKTRLARAIADNLSNALFLGLDRLDRGDHPQDDRGNVARAMSQLKEAGATPCDALIALLSALAANVANPLVIDMVENGLDEATQRALIRYLRDGDREDRTLIMLTRSSAILDLDSATDDELIIHCPANHAPPAIVLPYEGTPGYEAVASCLASPAVRARTHGLVVRHEPAS